MTSAPAIPIIELLPKVEIPTEVDSFLATLDSQALTQSSEVRAMVISDNDGFEAAVAQGRIIATFIGEAESARKKLSAPLLDKLNPIREAFKAVLDVAEADKRFLSALCGQWTAKQFREQQERDRLARVEADRLAQEAKLNAAIKAEGAGLKPAAVDQILSSPITTAPAPIMQSAPKPEGTSGRVYWKLYPLNPDQLDAEFAEEIAFRKLVVAAAQNQFLMCFLERNVSACDSEAKKGRLCQIPGYEALQDNRALFRKL